MGELGSYSPVKTRCPGCPNDAPVGRIMEDQQALEQTAALHFCMLLMWRKVKMHTQTRSVLKAGLLGSAPTYPPNSDDMFLSAWQMNWPTFTGKPPWPTIHLCPRGSWILSPHLFFSLSSCVRACSFSPSMGLSFGELTNQFIRKLVISSCCSPSAS